jgi:outer membrane beta-barrel protein
MKTNIQLCGFAILALFGTVARAEEAPTPAPAPVIEPQIDRRDINIPKIAVDDYEVGLYVGLLNMDDFGASFSYGVRGVYHLTEDFFIEGMVGFSKVSDEGYSTHGIPILEDPPTPLTHYDISVGYNLFPGEVFLSDKRSMNSVLYVIGGVGSMKFNDESQLSFNIGAGIYFVPRNWLTLRFDVRDYMFRSDITGINELKHNIELSTTAAWYF